MSNENKWEYDGSIKKYPIAPGEVWEQEGNKVAINDIFDGLPAFMKEADLVFIDPPWNLGNANAFVTKAAGLITRMILSGSTRKSLNGYRKSTRKPPILKSGRNILPSS